MSLLDVFGPNDIGRKPGFEIPLWRWRHPQTDDEYQISRAISRDQALSFNQIFDMQWARQAFVDGALFRLDRFDASHPGRARIPMSTVSVERGKQGGLDNWEIELFDRRGVSGAYATRPPVDRLELDLWVTFLLDYLELDPEKIRQSVRGPWGVPYIAVQSQRIQADNFWARPYLMPDDPMEVLRDTWREGSSEENRALKNWVRTFGNSFMKPPSRDNLFGVSSPNKNMLRIQNGYLQIDLHWDMNPTPETLEKHQDQLLFHALVANRGTAWHLTPMAAINETQMLVADDDAVQDWVDDHVLEGGHGVIPQTDFEAYLLLGDQDIPPLFRPMLLLEFLQARGVRMPWEQL